MPLYDPTPVAIQLLTCPHCGQEFRAYAPSAALPPELQDALAELYAGLTEGGRARRNGFYHQGLTLALSAVARFVMAGWVEPLSEDDRIVLDLLRDGAADHHQAALGRKPARLKSASAGRGHPSMNEIEIGYRAWGGRASLAQIAAGTPPVEADRRVSVATQWVDQDPAAAKALGGTLSRIMVRDARLLVEKTGTHPVARFARLIPIAGEATGSEAEQVAAWFLEQLASPAGQAFVGLPKPL